MPSISQSYEVILDFTNDTHDSATVQLLRDYGRPSNRIVLLNPGETMSLVLDAGDTYKYTVKTRSKVVNITARAWRDVVCGLSQLFLPGSSPWPPQLVTTRTRTPVNGITVDRHFRETRFCLFDYSDP
ncbi:uncharacterized protein FOMMEDRAFT_139805 [Fomitiporia mediterranea MF3/22]|uniref:uncharacterized protein n=1 Tax=Fomitiporia mediterranea (strain MF3/22) TaxID=694068 RepID=UPI000440832D|nr:uncharacterized protein FOMMEDRAFT_139805 [Fomitiporia mediterranea MF3/22]EJD03568.1 hypothetical protein FOMMEDRAFT_139805 [Fomitiporia mediterranea MF3/22]